MFDYSPLWSALAEGPLVAWSHALPSQVAQALAPSRHGDLPRWQAALAALPVLPPHAARLDQPCLTVGGSDTLDEAARGRLREVLMELRPWRKGPFCLHGLRLDAEWRSDWKWARVAPCLEPLAGRRVLDVGCGNGYYAWRLRGAGARLVLGVDPSLRFVCQYQALRHFLGEHPVYVLPLSLEDLPEGPAAFDTVLSMGVLYHRRDPPQHLRLLRRYLRPGGQLLLETLVVEGADALVPEGRYARMRNVGCLPAPVTLEGWLRQAGYQNVRLWDITPTTPEEQRATEWMPFESLAQALDPACPERTVEGLPAPRRAILSAQAPRA